MLDKQLELPEALLTHLVRLLRSPAYPRPFPDKKWQPILAFGWAYLHQVDDLFAAQDHRLLDLPFDVIAHAAALPFAELYARPRFTSERQAPSTLLSLIDLTGLAIVLEQMGFAVDPGPMCAALAAAIAGKARLTAAEREIHLYARLRARCRLQVSGVQPMEPGVAAPYAPPTEDAHYSDWTSPQYGFACVERAGSALHLTVTGRLWREIRYRQVQCADCGHAYARGDTEEVLGHWVAHAEALRTTAPRAVPALRKRLVQGRVGERVDQQAPLWMHRAIEARAYCFKREFRYSWLQWQDVKHRDDLKPDWVGFLLADNAGVIDGACAFHREDGEWSLQWVWIRPARRRHGLLAARWQAYLEQFGDFWIETPLSPAMKRFVQRHATPGQLRLLAERDPQALAPEPGESA